MPKHKFNAVKTVIDGYTFASKLEAKRYGELLMLQKAGEISGLMLQPSYALVVVGNGCGNEPKGFTSRVGTYVADFTYFDKRTQMVIIEDVKGFKTPLYRWKKKHVEAQYGVTITEITYGR